MKRVFFAFALLTTLAFGALALGLAAATADDPKPAQQPQPAPKALPAIQPKAIQVLPGQPAAGGAVARVTAAKMAQLEEDFETLEANRDVRKAYVKAAEVALKAAEAQADLTNKVAGNVSAQERLKAQLEVEAAKAQLDIRVAEMKEVEVKIKHAKKRLDDAKAAGVIGKVVPKPVDPPPPQ